MPAFALTRKALTAGHQVQADPTEVHLRLDPLTQVRDPRRLAVAESAEYEGWSGFYKAPNANDGESWIEVEKDRAPSASRVFNAPQFQICGKQMEET